MSNPNSKLMLDVQTSDSNSVPYEVFEASQGQLREAAVALSKHKSSLASALGEVNNLRSMVGALEKNVETLKIQNEDLFEKLRESRRSEEQLLSQVTKLTDTTDFLSQQLQQHAKTAAQRYSSLLELKEETEAALRLRLDRVTEQLLSSQHPQTRVIPWSYTFKQTDHPAHIVKMVVQNDATRENRMMRLQMLATASGENEDGVLDLEKLIAAANSDEVLGDETRKLNSFLENDRAAAASAAGNSQAASTKNNDIFNDVSKSSGFAEDAQVWRNVCRRLHQVLSERRMLLRTKTDGPLEFLLRTRHELAACVVQMREEVKKVNVVLNTMLEKIAGKTASNNQYQQQQQQNQSATMAVQHHPLSSSSISQSNAITLKMFEGSIEILQTSVSDISHTIQRALASCLTDADRILLGVSQIKISSNDSGSKLNTSGSFIRGGRRSPTTSFVAINNNNNNNNSSSLGSSSTTNNNTSSLRSAAHASTAVSRMQQQQQQQTPSKGNLNLL